MKGYPLAIALLILILGLMGGFMAPVQAATTPQDVYDYINCCLVASAETKALLLRALEHAFQTGALAPERILAFLKRIDTSGAPIELRDGVLETIAQALLEDLPVEMLLRKVEEGLAKGRPMDEILAEIRERKITLEEVKRLLEGKGFKVGIQLQLGPVTLQVDITVSGILITDVAGALEDYVRNGNDPQDALAVQQAVLLRLQRDRNVPSVLVDWFKENVTPQELSQIAQGIAARLAAMREKG